VIAANLTSYGFSGVCGAVNASGLSVLAVEEGSPATMARLSDEIALTTASTSGPVVLGCAGMARHRATLEARTGAVLIDGVESAALLAAAMIRLGRGSSRTL